MKKYCLGVRNNEKHPYSMMFQTNYKWIAKVFSIFMKLLVNETNISLTENIIIKENEPPFANQYIYKKDLEE